MTITAVTDRALLAQVAALHCAFALYTECGHQHTDKDVGVLDVDDVGLACSAGIVEYVCAACCLCDGQQSECCAEHHQHDRAGTHLCATRDLLADVIGAES